MANISTSYMGLTLSSPIIVGACSLSKKVDTIKRIEAAGAGALVIKSLFQEQIEMEQQVFEDALQVGADHFAESLRYFPDVSHAGPKEHLMWTELARKSVKMPLIASLNARTPGTWVAFAKQLESTGVDALELNVYAVEANPDATAADIEKRLCDIVAGVRAAVRIPITVKLSPFYTAMANVCKRVTEAGANGLTLFNRFYQPDIDIEEEGLAISLEFSGTSETRLPLRWIALLSDQIKVDFAATTGVHTGKDVIRHLLAGADVTQVVSTLYLHNIDYLGIMNHEISDWMDRKGYKSIMDFKGKVSRVKCPDAYAFERAQYIKLLIGRD